MLLMCDVRWWVIVISRSQYGGELGLLKQNCSDAEPLPTCHTYLQTQITAFVGPRSKSGRSAVTSMLLTIFRRSLSTTLSSPYVVANPSVICLSVCLWRWYTVLKKFNFSAIGPIYTSSSSLGIRAFCVKILARNSKGSRWSCMLNGSGYEKMAYGPICRVISETIQYILP